MKRSPTRLVTDLSFLCTDVCRFHRPASRIVGPSSGRAWVSVNPSPFTTRPELCGVDSAPVFRIVLDFVGQADVRDNAIDVPETSAAAPTSANPLASIEVGLLPT
jgi:hypothetical protein